MMTFILSIALAAIAGISFRGAYNSMRFSSTPGQSHIGSALGIVAVICLIFLGGALSRLLDMMNA